MSEPTPPLPHPDSLPSMPGPASDSLEATLTRHGLALPPAVVVQLDNYCGHLWDWNRKLNLTRHTDYEKFVARDLIDGMQLAPLLKPGEAVLDVGSGGGVPGVLLAILRPDVRVSLSESVGKKAAALGSIVESLKLAIPVHHARAEHLLADLRFDALTARAVGPLWKMLKWFQPHWSSIGRLLIIKGPKWVEERGEARHRGLLQNVALRRASVYTTPGTDAENVILKIWPKGREEP